jgi:2-dehydropantoate 2-reductase
MSATFDPPQWVVVGAGSVGLHLAARLRRAGHAVLVVTRRADSARVIAQEGIELSDPAEGGRFTAAVEAACGLEAVDPARLRGIVLLCTRIPDLDSVAAALARRQPAATPACIQNGIGHESHLARRFDRVVGVVVRQTSTRTDPARVRATGRGRLIVGAGVESRDAPGARAARDALAGAFAAAGFDTGVSDDLDGDRWLKLCINLMSTPNAVVRPADHATRAFVELKARLLEEARDALRAAGIEPRSGDGRDRSLEEEIHHQRASLDQGTSGRAWPIYNSVWTALREGRPLETPRFHRRIVELALAHGGQAPLNARMIRVLERCAAEGLGPESSSAAELLDPTLR